MKGKYIKLSATDINYIKITNDVIRIFEEPDGSNCSISMKNINKLNISATGDLSIWIDMEPKLDEYADQVKKDRFVYALDRFEYELEKEKREIEKFIKNL